MNDALMIGLLGTLVVIVGLSIWFGLKAGSGKKKNSMPVVAGLIIGTLVGGSSTVGTAQLAFTYGMSGWWFTLGGGISCLILALVYVRPLRRSGCSTLIGIIRNEYGSKAGIAASILNGLGTFINVISQIISATAVVATIFPAVGVLPAAILTAVFMALYVVFGGTKGAGKIGVVKTALLYVTALSCSVIVLVTVGGIGAFQDMVHGIHNPENINFFSLFARGVNKDLSAALSLLLGVVTTQTYAQAILSAKTDAAGRGGALISAFLIPPIGISGILVGLYMRANIALYPTVTEKTALTLFITTHMPPVLAGIMLGTLFVTAVGAGAGLALGISSIVNNEVLKRALRKERKPEFFDRTEKICILIVLALACSLSTGIMGDIILQYAFLSMGLRAAVVFCPLCAALFFPGRVDRHFAFAAIIAGPAVVFLGSLVSSPLDPLFLGVGAALLIMMMGAIARKRSSNQLL